jgi:hypothetical protein
MQPQVLRPNALGCHYEARQVKFLTNPSAVVHHRAISLSGELPSQAHIGVPDGEIGAQGRSRHERAATLARAKLGGRSIDQVCGCGVTAALQRLAVKQAGSRRRSSPRRPRRRK